VVIIGGTSGIGLRLAETYAARGRDIVIAGRDLEHATSVAAGIEGRVTGCALDLAAPAAIAAAVGEIGAIDKLVLAAIERDKRLDAQLQTMFMVGYQPGAVAHPHDHPFEESHYMLDGEVDVVADGDRYTLRPGDVPLAALCAALGVAATASARPQAAALDGAFRAGGFYTGLPPAAASAAVAAPGRIQLGSRPLRRGNSGWDVAELQLALA
jgi:NAD(P)-dependent dehydrogenase (short-subunit alcohol dehydrogenase family)